MLHQKNSIEWSNIVPCVFLAMIQKLDILHLSNSLGDLNSRLTLECTANSIALQCQWRAAKHSSVGTGLLNNLAQANSCFVLGPFSL